MTDTSSRFAPLSHKAIMIHSCARKMENDDFAFNPSHRIALSPCWEEHNIVGSIQIRERPYAQNTSSCTHLVRGTQPL